MKEYEGLFANEIIQRTIKKVRKNKLSFRFTPNLFGTSTLRYEKKVSVSFRI
jgi:hypothetical protein